MDIDLDLNAANVSWTIPYAIAAGLFWFATWRSHGRLTYAETELAPESMLWASRVIWLLCLVLAGFCSGQTLVGILAIFKVEGGPLSILLVSGWVMILAGAAEIWSVNCMNVAIRRETKEGLWDSVNIPKVPD